FLSGQVLDPLHAARAAEQQSTHPFRIDGATVFGGGHMPVGPQEVPIGSGVDASQPPGSIQVNPRQADRAVSRLRIDRSRDHSKWQIVEDRRYEGQETA